MNKDNIIGGQAFPYGDPTHGGEFGMTLRDYFAAKAMQGLTIAFPEWTHHEIADSAFGQADEMLEVRK